MTIAHYAFHSRTDTYRLTYADLLGLSRALGAVVRAGSMIVARAGWTAAKAFWDWYLYRKSVAALVALDDHILRDIGIHRGEIHAAARFSKKTPSADYRFSRLHTG